MRTWYAVVWLFASTHSAGLHTETFYLPDGSDCLEYSDVECG